MFKIGDILKNTVLLLCGTVNEENDLQKINYVIENNINILKDITTKILVLNTSLTNEKLEEILSLISNKYNFIILPDHINRRYQIGFIDGDMIGFNYIKYNNIKYDYIIKMNIDILLFPEFLNLEFNIDSDLIYIPEITSLEKLLYSNERYIEWKQKSLSFDITNKESFITWHQPWLYIISKNVSCIYNNESLSKLNELFYKWLNSVDGDLNNCHKQNEFLCSEDMMNDALLNKNYKKYCLIRDNHFDNYCEFIKQCNIGDATIKNVHIKNYGICHFHDKNSNIIEIEV